MLWTLRMPFILYPTWTFLPLRRLLARMIPFTALRNFDFRSSGALRPSAAARSKPESCFVGPSKRLGEGGGWSGDRAAWRSSAASSAAFWRLFWRLWGGEPALGRLWGGDPWLSRRNDIVRRRRVYSLHKVQPSGAAQSTAMCGSGVHVICVPMWPAQRRPQAPRSVDSARLIIDTKNRDDAQPRTKQSA